MRIAEQIGVLESKDIDKQVDRIIRELGNPQPPLSLPQVRMLLELDLSYYNRSDLSIFDRFSHKLKVAGKQILNRPKLLREALIKLDLKALWLPDTKRILIDKSTPKLKHRWIEGHEISHSIIPWHNGFGFGDNKQTLSPACDQIVEAEANYSAGRLLFLGDRFSEEARDLKLSFESILKLKKIFGNSLTSTLWRMVEEYWPNQPIFGMISAHPHHPSIGKSEQRFIRSAGFRKQFNNVQPLEVYDILKRHARRSKGGPVVDAQDALCDQNGDQFIFQIESFSNTHDLLTIGHCKKQKPIIVPT